MKNNDLISLKKVIKQIAPQGKPDFQQIFSQGTEIAVWNAKHGKAITSGWILLLLTDLNNYFNIPYTMNAGQLEDVAAEIVEEWWWLKFEDIIAFTAGMKKNIYGKIYNRLDGTIIFDHLHEYVFSRNMACDQKQTAYKGDDARVSTENDRMQTGMVSLSTSIEQLKNQFNDRSLDSRAVQGGNGPKKSN